MSANAIKGLKNFQPIPLAARFIAKVKKPAHTSCWMWVGATKGRDRPYGIIWVEGRHRPAPQVAWEIHNRRPFPSGKMACHTCDNPACVNPEHIWPGTMSENILDAVAKGRSDSGGNAYRTHCKHGHEFTPDNTIIRPSTGHRQCRACRDRFNRMRYAK